MATTAPVLSPPTVITVAVAPSVPSEVLAAEPGGEGVGWDTERTDFFAIYGRGITEC